MATAPASIVADYFGACSPTSWPAGLTRKAAHNAALRERIPRSRGSVEFKYQNVSAVLEKLGMPWIPGYKPARHYQGAIVEVIARYIARYPEVLDMPVSSPLVPNLPDRLFAHQPPPPAEPNEQLPASLRRLIAKFDPVERDLRNRALGRAGEEFVVGARAPANSPRLAAKIFLARSAGSPTRRATARATTCCLCAYRPGAAPRGENHQRLGAHAVLSLPQRA